MALDLTQSSAIVLSAPMYVHATHTTPLTQCADRGTQPWRRRQVPGR